MRHDAPPPPHALLRLDTAVQVARLVCPLRMRRICSCLPRAFLPLCSPCAHHLCCPSVVGP